MNHIENFLKNKEYKKLGRFLFDKEQKDVKNKIYWNKPNKSTFIYQNLEIIEKIWGKTKNKQLKEKISLVLWIFYQHSFQGLISNSKEEIRKKYDIKESKYFSKMCLKYYKGYWKGTTQKNIFPLLIVQFTKNNLKNFERILKENKGEDKVWKSNQKLIKNMIKKLIGKSSKNFYIK